MALFKDILSTLLDGIGRVETNADKVVPQRTWAYAMSGFISDNRCPELNLEAEWAVHTAELLLLHG